MEFTLHDVGRLNFEVKVAIFYSFRCETDFSCIAQYCIRTVFTLLE